MYELDADWLNDYYSGRLVVEGIDYCGDSAYEYWSGRSDAQLKCGPESKRCGNACIPKWKKCRASWNKPVKALAGAAALTGAAVAGTALFHRRSEMRNAARGMMNPIVQTGFAAGNLARGNTPGAANNAVNVAASAEGFGGNAKTVVQGYGKDLKNLHKRGKQIFSKNKSGYRVTSRQTPYGG